VMNCDEQF